MSDLELELTEDLQRQELEKFWKENGSWIITGVVLAVVFVGAFSWWRQHTFDKNLAETSQLMAILDAPDAGKLDAYADASGRDHAVIARFAEAALYAKRDESDKAVAVYQKIANTTGVDRTYRELAQVLSISQRLDKGDPATLHKELSALTGSQSPWRYSALEMEALLYAREGQTDKAVKELTDITADSAAPDNVRQRAIRLRDIYAGGAPGKQG